MSMSPVPYRGFTLPATESLARRLLIQNERKRRKHIMRLFVYDIDTMEEIAVIEGIDNTQCEDTARALNLDGEYHGWSYTEEGLERTEHTDMFI